MPRTLECLVVEASVFEDDEYTVTVRPPEAPAWQALPIGQPNHKQEIETCAAWLRTALREIAILAANLTREE